MEPVQGSSLEDSQVHSFNPQKQLLPFKWTNKAIIICFAVVFLGIVAGFLLSKNGGISKGTTGSNLTSANLTKGTTFGSDDTNTFKDTAEGIVKEGGIDGEGNFHLVRPGGDSQNVYMTSSVVDLASLVDRKVKVWGQTQKAQHAGWLMDVGRIEILE